MDISKLPIQISISGVRAHSPEILDEKLAYAFVRTFCELTPEGPIVVARDSRPTGILLKKAVLQALHDAGRDILDADLVPLPTAAMAVARFMAAGAIHITASHNPPEYNGLKFLNMDGEFISQLDVQRLKEYISSFYLDDIAYTDATEIDPLDIHEDAIYYHLEKVKAVSEEGKELTVAVDAVNGAGSHIVPRFLEEIGCKVINLANDPGQPFPHLPEPTPDNLVWTQEQLKGKRYDLCVVVDPDADRLVLIDEAGELLSEEYTLPLIACDLVARKSLGKFVVNLSTSQMCEILTRDSLVSVEYAAVGEANVVAAMKESEAIFGGEGNGGIIDPMVHYGRDALTGIAHIVNLLRREDVALGQMVSKLPDLVMKKEKLSVEGVNLESLYIKLRKEFSDASVNDKDGLRFMWPDQQLWIHVRPSNTEPILRIIAEGKTEGQLQAKVKQVKSLL